MKLAIALVAAALSASAACSQSSPPATRAPAVTAALADGSLEVDDGCLPLSEDRPDESASLLGTLFVDDAFTHPNGTKTRPYILRLDTPRCVDGLEPVREVHVGAVEGVDLRPWIGRRVRVSGSAMQAMTAWHARDVVLLASSARAP